MLRSGETWQGGVKVPRALDSPSPPPYISPKPPLAIASDFGITQDRIPGIDQLIPNFHSLYNDLEIFWAGRLPNYSPWRGLEIPLAATSDPRSDQGNSQYMEWVIEQNVKRYARLVGWDGTGYAMDYMRGSPTVQPLSKVLDVSRFSIQDARVVLKPLDYTDFVSGEAVKTGLIAEEGLYKRKLDQLNEQAKVKAGQVVTGKDVARQNVGFLNMVDKFFVWVNALLGD